MITVAAALLGSCATEVVNVSANSSASAPVAVDSGGLAGCGYWLGSLIDVRDGSGQSGEIAGRDVLAPDLIKRIELGLARVPIVRTTGDSKKEIKIELVSAYGYSKSTSMTFTTVLRARLGDKTRIARGSETGINWASGQGEITRMLFRSADLATSDLNRQLREDCAQR